MTPVRSELNCEVVIVGAGPYGLAAAANLKAAHVDVRIFGDPMSFWRDHMPRGMKMRSGWNVTHLSDPGKRYTLNHYVDQRGYPTPKLLPLEDFIDYGEWFQERAVPDVDMRKVTRVTADNGAFRVDLDDGSYIRAARVVMATGLEHQEYRPEEFAEFPRELVSHAVEHSDLSKFRGRRVGVVGRGQSACESAAILSQAGADVELIARGEITWLGLPKPGAAPDTYWRKKLRHWLSAPTGVGPFPVSWLNEFPGLGRLLTQSLRDKLNTASLGAGVTGWVKPGFERVRINAGKPIVGARLDGDQVGVVFPNEVRHYDHVLLGTGYRIDISKSGLLDPALLAAIRRIGGSPELRIGFESSVPGLHFLGASAVRSYGPLLRFIAGSDFAARALTRTVTARRASARSRGRGVIATPALAKPASR
ncbi:MAG TPA: NAD(P)-binding domain-containing protein [Xanthobacteraceae bacterium]|nr:NAD(P)-binding domain-containing protein [Xanthobacteraceae bacterium]